MLVLFFFFVVKGVKGVIARFASLVVKVDSLVACENRNRSIDINYFNYPDYFNY